MINVLYEEKKDFKGLARETDLAFDEMYGG
jgi:hypothetical protein